MGNLEQTVTYAGLALVFALLLFVPDWQGLMQAYIDTLAYHINGRW